MGQIETKINFKCPYKASNYPSYTMLLDEKIKRIYAEISCNVEKKVLLE